MGVLKAILILFQANVYQVRFKGLFFFCLLYYNYLNFVKL